MPGWLSAHLRCLLQLHLQSIRFRLTKMLLSGEFFHCHFSDFCEPVVIAFDADTVFCAPLAVALAALAALVDDIKPVLDTKLSVWC